MKSPDQFPVEGMQHGPFPTPDLIQHPDHIAHSWIQYEAKENPEVYQLLMLRESLIDDKVNRKMSDESIDLQRERIGQAIQTIVNLEHIRDIKNPRPTYKKTDIRGNNKH